MSAECFIKSSSILIWNSFSDKFTFLKGCQRAAFTAWRLKKIETKLKFPAFFKRNGEEVRGSGGEDGARLHPGNLFRELFLKALAVQKSVFPRSTMYLLVLAFPFSRAWAVVFFNAGAIFLWGKVSLLDFLNLRQLQQAITHAKNCAKLSINVSVQNQFGRVWSTWLREGWVERGRRECAGCCQRVRESEQARPSCVWC